MACSTLCVYAQQRFVFGVCYTIAYAGLKLVIRVNKKLVSLFPTLFCGGVGFGFGLGFVLGTCLQSATLQEQGALFFFA
jgi:hypothetical protein